MKHALSKLATADAQISVIGLGNVGGAVCNNLLKHNFNVNSVYDAYKDNIDFGEKVAVHRNLKDAVQHSDIVVTALPKPENIRDLVLNQQMFECMKDDAIWIDHSTTDYWQTLQFAKEAKEKRNISTLECPVSGGITLLKKGQMSMFVGGDYDVFQACEPYLQCSSNKILYLGELGTATITKVVSNMLASTNTVAMGEALMIAKRAGIDLEQFWNAIRFSSGNSFVWETEAPLVFNGSYDTDFAVELQCKDMRLGNQLCEQFGVPLPVHSLVHQIYNTAKYRYGENAPSTIPVKIMEDTLNDERLQIEGKFDKWTYSIDTKNNTVTIVHKFE